MFPQAEDIPRMCAEDTTLVVGNEAGDQVTIPVPKGSHINFHIAGLHYNRRCSSKAVNRVCMTKSSSLLGRSVYLQAI
jgi:hypothetical protein